MMGRWTEKKGGVEHSSTLEGNAINGPQLKTNTYLLTSPLSWLVKASGTMFVLALFPPSLYISFQTQSPNRDRCNQSGKLDGGQIVEKGTSIGSACRQPCWFRAGNVLGGN